MYIRTVRGRMRGIHTGVLAGAAISFMPLLAQGQVNPLVTGKKITLPPVGIQQNVGSLPMNLILSPNGLFAISSDMGFRQSLWAIDSNTGLGVSHVDFPGGSGIPNPLRAPAANGLYYGLAVTDNGNGTSTIFAAQGQIGQVAVVSMNNNTGALSLGAPIKSTTASDFPAGIALFKRNGVSYLAVAMNDPDAFNIPCALVIFNAATGLEVGRYTFAASFGGTPNFPLAVAATADGSAIYVSSQRDGGVYVLNGTNPAALTLTTSIPTGSHPIALLLNKAQTTLFVANAHSDTVSVINTLTTSVANTIALRPAGAPVGATPTNLALSPDEQTLYVTLGDMNTVAVVNLAKTSGAPAYIPTGWYPTGVVVTAKKKLLVSNAKGVQTRYPNPGYTLSSFNSNPQYDHNMIEGTVSTILAPNSTTLAAYTNQVLANNFLSPAHPDNPLSFLSGKIQHVIYIIKENRTYDQVLGDLVEPNGQQVGNGDATLTLFGQQVTPNQHALALRFVTLDNFYNCAEASGDGWPWCTQGMANEYVIKNLPYNYSGRGRNYDFEGTNNGYPVGGFPALSPDNTPLSQAFPGGLPAIPDVAMAPGKHIWDNALAGGRSIRNYGFFVTNSVVINGTIVIPDNYPADTGLQPGGHDLAGNTDVDFRKYDNDYPDSDAPNLLFQQTGDPTYLYAETNYGKHNAPSRFSEWNNEFQQMLAKGPNGSAVPNFMMVRFHHDHTQGVARGKHLPVAEVADNDFAVGQLVQAVSNSAIWNSTAIFIVEDDSQDGPDHVDAHRSTCYVISPFIKRNSVDHTFYNTDSVIKTMNLLMGLPVMTQYDAVATPILDWDTMASNQEPYTATLPAGSILIQKTALNLNPKNPLFRLAQLSDKMDFVHPDSADPRVLNEILWKSVKGVDSTMPAPRHTVVPVGQPSTAVKKSDSSRRSSASIAHTQRPSDDD